MSATLTIAGLTIREALRRRITVGAFVIALLFLGLLFLPRFAARSGRGVELDIPTQISILTMVGLAMIKFFSAVLGITLASGAVSTELERGTLYVILSKPLRRWHVVLGKWLGLVALLSVNVAVWAALLWLAVWARERGTHLPVLKAVALTFLYPLIFTTLTLWFSTFATNVLATAVALVAIGIGWQEGMMRSFARVFEIDLLGRFAVFAGYLVPIGRLQRWALSVAELRLPFGMRPGGAFNDEPAPVPFDLIYVAGYILVALLLAMVTFQRRDV
jgi:ABC-type transport system involved in multi-copper enzyme maturation permease subunit